MIYLAALVLGAFASSIVNFRDAPWLWGMALFGIGAMAFKSQESVRELRAELERYRRQATGSPEGADLPPFVADPSPSAQSPQQQEIPEWLKAKTSSTPEHEPTPASAPPPSDPVGQAVRSVIQYFLTGNTIAKIGMVLLFFGVCFLVKFTSDKGLLPIELRLSAAALGATALSAVGWHLREKKAKFAMILQGGGLGVLYVVVFAAYRVYSLLPALPALGILVAVTGLLTALALLQNEMALAVMATAGAFLAPVLASKGEGSHVALFSYFAVVNGAILAIAYSRSWRWLNLQGFLFTFGLVGFWGASAYRPAQFASTEPFLALFFAIYFAVGVLFARASEDKSGQVLDGAIVFGTPIAAFALQARLAHGVPYALASTAAALALLYVSSARWLHARDPRLYRFLAEAFLAVGVCFATLTIPFALSGDWVSAAWALEGTALVWVGLRQSRRRALWSGVGLLAVATALFYFNLAVAHPSRSTEAFANVVFLGSALLAFALGAAAYVLSSAKQSIVREPARIGVTSVLLVIALIEFFRGSFVEFERLGELKITSEAAATGAAFAFFGVASFLLVELADRLRFKELGLCRFAFAPIASAWLIKEAVFASDFHAERAAAELVGLAFVFWRTHRDEGRQAGAWQRRILVIAPLLALAAFATTELSRLIAKTLEHESFWNWVPHYLAPAGMGAALLSGWPRWPSRAHRASLLRFAIPILIGYSLLVSTARNFFDSGATVGVRYWPVLSAMDLAQIFVLIVTARAIAIAARETSLSARGRTVALAAVGALALIWLSGLAARTVHSLQGTPWDFASNFENVVIQTSVTILWSAAAFALMLISSRRQHRPLWVAGGVVLGLVVAKLFTVDFVNQGTLGRIVSFIGTGLILLAIGYIAPLPPAETKKQGSHP